MYYLSRIAKQSIFLYLQPIFRKMSNMPFVVTKNLNRGDD